MRRSVLGLAGEDLPLQSQGVFDIIIAKNAVQFFPQVDISLGLTCRQVKEFLLDVKFLLARGGLWSRCIKSRQVHL